MSIFDRGLFQTFLQSLPDPLSEIVLVRNKKAIHKSEFYEGNIR